ncbi:MAG: Bug family tripartite tricarboxylate transporter substrate binding protein [Paracoccus sp. (in: a-proteobacteria)]|uniref:Bug family tripartite tricarboxylate transporter substrate binding protein n=1 Tax=Paracoccus sp. TaxID=267 RepID=UPI00391C23B0
MNRFTLILGAALLSLGAGAQAQDYPSQPVRMIVPFAPGGPNDTVARLIAPTLAQQLGQPVVVENRAGAGGVLGTDAVAKARPDGHVIGISSAGALAISESVLPQMPYATATDLTPVMLVGRVPELLVVTPDLPVQDLPGLVAWAGDNPGALAYASSGPGAIQHLAGEMLNLAAGTDALHVPYGGAAPAITDVIGGQVQMMFADLPVLLPHVKAGNLRALAVAATERSDALPDVPTTAEAGYPDVIAENWYGIIAPAGLPENVAQTLQDAVAAALADEGLRAALDQQGVIVAALPGAEFGAYLQSEAVRWKTLIDETGAIQQ